MITERPAPELRPGDECEDVDIILHGLVLIRVIGHRPDDLAAIEAQFGPTTAAGPDPADITVRFVDDAAGLGPLRYLGPGEAGFTDDGFVVLQGRFRRPVRVRLPVADLGGPCEILCEHGVGRVPHLVAIVNLAILANGGLALHASGFETDGTVTVATGWSKGGKTEALLAHCRAGARYVGDEWLHVHPDRRISGIHEPLRVWDWHLDQLPEIRRDMSRRDRFRLRSLGLADRAAASSRRSDRITTAIRRQRFVDLGPAAVAPAGVTVEPLPLGRVFLMTSGSGSATTVTSIDGAEVAARMAASLTYERLPLTAAVDAFRYAFPSSLTTALDQVPEQERARLHQFLDDVESYEVVHPYPVDLDALGAAMDQVAGGAR